MECEGDGDTNCNWCPRYSHQKDGLKPGGLVETIQTTAVLRSTKILRSVLVT